MRDITYASLVRRYERDFRTLPLWCLADCMYELELYHSLTTAQQAYRTAARNRIKASERAELIPYLGRLIGEWEDMEPGMHKAARERKINWVDRLIRTGELTVQRYDIYDHGDDLYRALADYLVTEVKRRHPAVIEGNLRFDISQAIGAVTASKEREYSGRALVKEVVIEVLRDCSTERFPDMPWNDVLSNFENHVTKT